MIITKKAKDLKPVNLVTTENQTIFIITAGQNGTEYNKTEGYFSNFEGISIYQCLYGQGILIMQRNDDAGEAKEFKVVTLNSGRQVGVPAGWVMCLVNIGKTFLVVVGNLNINSKDIDTKPIMDKQGLAYYVVEKKGEVGFEQNPNYENHPQITTE